MSDHRPSPYALVLEASDPPESDSFLTMRRYYVAAPIEAETGFPFLMSLTRHFATLAEAVARLPQFLEEFPTAAVASALLAFDPNDPEQLAAFHRLSAEIEIERATLQ